MASCPMSIDSYQSENGELSVIDKYESLMQTSLGENSIYYRGKETLLHQFEDLQLTEKEKAGFVLEYISTFTMDISKTSMQIAVAWAKEERDGGYQNALVKAQTENALADYEKTKEEICVLQKENDLKCVTIEATLAQSIRDNGTVAAYDPDEPCKPIALNNDGLKYNQTQQVIADTYRIFSDSYRKSGVVEIGIDPTDHVKKGLTGNTHEEVGELAGYTAQQSANAERQRIAYEDSKVNHAANSSASMIGQLLSAEVLGTEHIQDVQRWRDAVDRLLKPYSTTPIPA